VPGVTVAVVLFGAGEVAALAIAAAAADAVDAEAKVCQEGPLTGLIRRAEIYREGGELGGFLERFAIVAESSCVSYFEFSRSAWWCRLHFPAHGRRKATHPPQANYPANDH